MKPRWAFTMEYMPGFGFCNKYMKSPERDTNWLAHQLINSITLNDLAWFYDLPKLTKRIATLTASLGCHSESRTK